MNDKEITRLAYKALTIGADLEKDNDMFKLWNPLTNDGDALRLAVKLGMEVKIDWAKLQVSVWNGYNLWVYEDLSKSIEPFPATRRAIVRAAAEIGKSMS